jgi:hypothetical protein
MKFCRRMIRLGTALKSQEPPFHRCLVISDPQNNGGRVVLVRVITDDGTWPDHDCILTPVDGSELEHDSTVAYSTCKSWIPLQTNLLGSGPLYFFDPQWTNYPARFYRLRSP